MQHAYLEIVNFCRRNTNDKILNSKHSFSSITLSSSVILIVYLLMAVGLSGCSNKSSNSGNAQKGKKSGSVQVEIKVVQPELLLNTVSSTGSILANEKAEIRPEISEQSRCRLPVADNQFLCVHGPGR